MAAAAIAQTTVVSYVRLIGVSPNLVLLLAVSWVLTVGSREGALAGLVGGLMLDAFSGAPSGASTAALTLASVMTGLGEIHVLRTARVLPYAAIVLATLVYQIVLLLFMQMAGRVVLWWPMMWRSALPEVVVNTLFMPVIYYGMRWLAQRFQPHRVEWQ